MRRQSRLHLLFLCDLQSSSTVLPSLLSHPVETNAPPLGRILKLDLSTGQPF